MGHFIKTSLGALLSINVVMFVLFHIAVAIWGNEAVQWFGVSAPNPMPWIWSFVSYMFTQASLWDLMFGLLWIYFFGRLFLEIGTDRQLLVSYIVGGLCGAIAYLIGSVCGFHHGLILIGSSAAALSIVTCAALRAPYMRLHLMFFGAVEYRWIAIVAIVVSLLSFATGNTGGAIAHIGGVIGGMLAWRIIRRKMKFRISKPYIKKPNSSKTLDELLDKVKRSGYASLTAEERRQLLEYSKSL